MGILRHRRTSDRHGADHQVMPVYAAVYCLLLSWECDDLGVATEIKELSDVFDNAYGYHVEEYMVPSSDPDDALHTRLSSFVNAYESPRSLLIVYYAGHGGLNSSRLALWFGNRRSQVPRVKWYSHQRLLENSTSDVLLLLDCCQPLGGGGDVRAVTGKQVMAACGFSTEAPGVGPDSFSRALIDELRRSCLRPFDVSTLHYRIVTRLRTTVPDYRGETRETPVLSILGEGGIPSPSIQLISYASYPVNLIALMGVTGSGKSSLINKICGREVASVGRRQTSETKDVSHYVTVVNGQAVTLIDTPGFDDTFLTDRQILERISTYLYEHYESGRKLNGLLYLRDINDTKMTGSALKNLDMFARLCGDESLKNVMFLTTKWDRPGDIQERLNHEEDLTNKFWARMIRLGCHPPKRLGTHADSSLSIVDPIDDIVTPTLQFRPTWLQIQRELGSGIDLIDTSAGEYIDRGLSRNIKDYQIAIQDSLTRLQDVKVLVVKDALEAQAGELKEILDLAKSDKDALRTDFEKVRQAEAGRRAQLFGINLLDRLDDQLWELELKDSYFRQGIIGLASGGIYQACRLVWKKQGKGKDLLDAAKEPFAMIPTTDWND